MTKDGGGRELTEVWNADKEVGDEEAGRAVKTIGAFFDECGTIFKVCGYVCNSHEGHKRGTKENCVDKGLDVLLDRL